MSVRRLIWAILLVGSLVLSQTDLVRSAGSVYYVATDGDDGNPGSLTSPWRSIQTAVDRVGPGDTIYVRDGVYNEYIQISTSGQPDAAITLAAYPGEHPVLDGTGLNWRYGVDFGGEPGEAGSGASHWIVEGFQIRNYIRDGLYGNAIVGWYDNYGIILRDLEISGVGTVIKFIGGSDDLTLERIDARNYDGCGFDCGTHAGGGVYYPCNHVRIRHFMAHGPGGGDDTAVDGFAVEAGTDVIVEDSLAENHPGDGFDFKSDDTHLLRVVSRYQTRDGIKLWGTDATLVNGISHGNGLGGLVLEEGGRYTVTNSLIANSTIYGYTVVVGYEGGETHLSLHNNIFYNDVPANSGTLVFFGSGVQLSADHNLYWNPFRESCLVDAQNAGGCTDASDIPAAWSDGHDLYGDPRFVEPAAGDFHLMETSPAVDAGTSSGAPETDLDGRARPQGEGIDIGPYEFSETPAATTTPSPIPTPSPTATFTPTASPTLSPSATLTPTVSPTIPPSPLPPTGYWLPLIVKRIYP